MRRAIGIAALTAGAALALAGLGLGCSREARPPPLVVQPDESPPPLPPASGTPIGFLVDDAGALKLSDDQLTKLKAIDDDLATRLTNLDGIINSIKSVPPPAEKDDGKGRGLGFRAGGARGGAGGAGAPMGGGMETFPGASGGPPTAREGLAKPTTDKDNAATLARATEQRTYTLRDAIKRALALLDRDQQQIARRLLTERGVDPDTGESGVPAGAPPTQVKPGEP